MNRAMYHNRNNIVQNHYHINKRSIDCTSYQNVKDKQTTVLADTFKKATELTSMVEELKSKIMNDKDSFIEHNELKDEYIDQIEIELLCNKISALNENIISSEDSDVDQELAKTTACLEEASNNYEDELQCILKEIELMNVISNE